MLEVCSTREVFCFICRAKNVKIRIVACPVTLQIDLKWFWQEIVTCFFSFYHFHAILPTLSTAFAFR